MNRLLIFTVTMIFAADLGFAADSTFSKDKNHVYLIPDDVPDLIDLNFRKNTCGKIDLQESCNAPIRGVTSSNAGFILCSTTNAVWAYNPSNKQCVKVCDAPKELTLNDIAYDSKTGNLLAFGYLHPDANGHVEDAGIYILPKDEKEFQFVLNRYDEYASWVNHPVFSAQGTLYFISRGDLWEGSIEKDDPEGTVAGRYGCLRARRVAPVAELETQNGTPTSTGLNWVAISKHKIYARYARMNGSGWGSVIRFGISSSSGWKEMGKLFTSVEEIRDEPCAFLCSSPDNELVMFSYVSKYQKSNEVFLIHNDAKAVPVTFERLADLFKVADEKSQ